MVRKNRFISLLWEMLNDSRNKKSITWDKTGRVIEIIDVPKFEREIIPRYFKHSSLTSFTRQLYFYGFKKTGSKNHFIHDNFLRDEPNLLDLVVRKKNCDGGKSMDPLIEELENENQTLREELIYSHAMFENMLDSLENEKKINDDGAIQQFKTWQKQSRKRINQMKRKDKSQEPAYFFEEGDYEEQIPFKKVKLHEATQEKTADHATFWGIFENR
jgi:hypothetical protein